MNQINPQIQQSLAGVAELTVKQSRLAIDTTKAQLDGVSDFVQGAQAGNGMEGFQRLAKQSAEIGVKWFQEAAQLQKDFFSGAQAQFSDNFQTATAAASKATRGK